MPPIRQYVVGLVPLNGCFTPKSFSKSVELVPVLPVPCPFSAWTRYKVDRASVLVDGSPCTDFAMPFRPREFLRGRAADRFERPHNAQQLVLLDGVEKESKRSPSNRVKCRKCVIERHSFSFQEPFTGRSHEHGRKPARRARCRVAIPSWGGGPQPLCASPQTARRAGTRYTNAQVTPRVTGGPYGP